MMSIIKSRRRFVPQQGTIKICVIGRIVSVPHKAARDMKIIAGRGVVVRRDHPGGVIVVQDETV